MTRRLRALALLRQLARQLARVAPANDGGPCVR